MPTEAERAAIMAEYLAEGVDDVEDEAEFHPEDDNDDDSDGGFDDDDDDSDEQDDEMVETPDHPVLNGTVHVNDEGRVVCSGTWSMKKELEATEAGGAEESSSDSVDDDDEKKNAKNGKDRHHRKKKKKKKKATKFKLKSKQIVSPDGVDESKPLFDLLDPTAMSKKKKEKAAGKRMERTMLFDGFFFAGEAEGHRKIKERDVEVTFSSRDDGGSAGGAKRAFGVAGRGRNEFGAFRLSGVYTVDGADRSAPENALVCDKTYGEKPSSTASSSGRRSRRRRGWTEDESGDDDDDMSAGGDDGADFDEIIALNEEAGMSVEELRKRYYGGGTGGDGDNGDDGKQNPDKGEEGNGTAEPQSKRAKRQENDEESDDDAYGF